MNGDRPLEELDYDGIIASATTNTAIAANMESATSRIMVGNLVLAPLEPFKTGFERRQQIVQFSLTISAGARSDCLLEHHSAISKTPEPAESRFPRAPVVRRLPLPI